MRATTEKGLRTKLRGAAKACGVYRAEFEPLIARLAEVYMRIQTTRAEYEKSGASLLIRVTDRNGNPRFIKNPLLTELDALSKLALEMERELGMTPAALNRVNEAAMPTKGKAAEDPLAAALSQLRRLA